MEGYSGYWADTPYVEFHNAAQEPWRIAMETRRVGGAHPDLSAPFDYCDIGCGRGRTLLALAAALPHGRFHGVDLAAEHIDEARRLAAATGLSNVRFHRGAVESLPPGAIPPCDFVAAHGFFSWVTPEVAAPVLDFMARVVKPDGLVFASINLRSGWDEMLPVRRRLLEVYAAAPGDGAARLRAAVDAAWRDFGPGSAYAADNPVAAGVMAKWPDEPINYIPHELMNAAWRLFSLREAFGMFRGAGLAYAGERLSASAEMRERYPALIGAGDEIAVEDALSRAQGERFRALVFRPAAAATPVKAMFVAEDEVLGVASPREARELYPADLIDGLTAAERDVVRRTLDGSGATLAEIKRASGPEARLKLFATVNQLARSGELATYGTAPAAATAPARVAAAHPLSSALLSARYAVAVAAHLPSPVFGGAVHVPGRVAAVLRAHLEGARDLAAAAGAIWRDATGDPDYWAVTDPAHPREAPDFDDMADRYHRIWLPFLERMRVITPD